MLFIQGGLPSFVSSGDEFDWFLLGFFTELF